MPLRELRRVTSWTSGFDGAVGLDETTRGGVESTGGGIVEEGAGTVFQRAAS